MKTDVASDEQMCKFIMHEIQDKASRLRKRYKTLNEITSEEIQAEIDKRCENVLEYYNSFLYFLAKFRGSHCTFYENPKLMDYRTEELLAEIKRRTKAS